MDVSPGPQSPTESDAALGARLRRVHLTAIAAAAVWIVVAIAGTMWFSARTLRTHVDLAKMLEEAVRKRGVLPERHFEFTGDPGVSFYRGAGCTTCKGTGFKGRIGIHEVAVPNEEMRALLIEGAPLTRIADAARRGGFRSLRYDGLKKVLRGLTTIEEIEMLASD